MKIESFEETFLEEIEGIHSSSYSFNRGAQHDFIYGKRFDFNESGTHSTKDLPDLLFLRF